MRDGKEYIDEKDLRRYEGFKGLIEEGKCKLETLCSVQPHLCFLFARHFACFITVLLILSLASGIMTKKVLKSYIDNMRIADGKVSLEQFRTLIALIDSVVLGEDGQLLSMEEKLRASQQGQSGEEQSSESSQSEKSKVEKEVKTVRESDVVKPAKGTKKIDKQQK